jgi:hypothetical protein
MLFFIPGIYPPVGIKLTGICFHFCGITNQTHVIYETVNQIIYYPHDFSSVIQL